MKWMLGVLLTSLVAACSRLPPGDTTGVGTSAVGGLKHLLSNVCLPYIEHPSREAGLTRGSRLRRVHPMYFPQPTPAGLRQYVGPYDDISVVNISSQFCFIHVRGSNYEALENSVKDVLSASGTSWIEVPSRGPAPAVERVFCKTGGRVTVTTFEGDPKKVKVYPSEPSFDVEAKNTRSECNYKQPS
jgi:hypothetical protein